MASAFPNLPTSQRGNIHRVHIQSQVLQGNYWNDPTERECFVYTPQGYEEGKDYPMVIFLAGFAGTGEGMLARSLTDFSIATRCDRWIAEGCPPFVAVFPDCMSYLGGTQFVDSPAIGNYATHFMTEVIPYVQKNFSGQGKIGLTGRSSGGYGSVCLAMQYPELISAIACHAGDMGFETAFVAELTQALLPLHLAGSPKAFLEGFWQKTRFSPNDFAAFNLLCMSASYSPNLENEFPADIPIDLQTGQIKWEVFSFWKKHDPVEMIEKKEHQEALHSLDYFFIDVGRFDEYNLQFGARAFHQKLKKRGIEHIYEEFDGGHRGTTYRYDYSIPAMVKKLTYVG